MKKQPLIVIIPVCIGLVAAASPGQTPLGTAFPYQGQLRNNGLPASGSFDLQFKLFDAGTNGTRIGAAQCADNVAVSAGLFAVTLDFGAQFDGSSRWLEIGVRADSTAGNCATGSYTTLAPRQPITATPYASYAAGPWAKAGSNLAYTAGSIGIGTTSPATSLHIVDPAVAQVKLERTGGAALLMQAGTTVTRVGSTTTTRLGFLIGGNDQMTLDTSGHLGIGTASPDTDLHVFRGSAGAITANANAPLAIENNASNYLNLLAPDASETGILFGRPGSAATSAAGGILFNSSSNADGLQFRTGGNLNRMTIDSAGNVGIGTTNPTAKLHVVGSSGDASVILPNSSIGASEIADEPGVACDIVNSNDQLAPFSSLHTAASRSINCPTAGYVLAIGTVTLYPENSDGQLNVGISNTSSALLGTSFHRHHLLNGKFSTVTVQGIFSVVAGSRSVYLLVQPDSSNPGQGFFSGAAHLTLMFLPTAYGTVDSDG